MGNNPGLNPTQSYPLAANVPFQIPGSPAASDTLYSISNAGASSIYVATTSTSDPTHPSVLNRINGNGSDTFIVDGAVYVFSVDREGGFQVNALPVAQSTYVAPNPNPGGGGIGGSGGGSSASPLAADFGQPDSGVPSVVPISRTRSAVLNLLGDAGSVAVATGATQYGTYASQGVLTNASPLTVPLTAGQWLRLTPTLSTGTIYVRETV